MKRENIKELIEYGRLSWQKDLTPGISGNMSTRFKDGIIITSSGVSNGFLTESDFSVVDYDGNFVSGNPKPSSERFLHIEYYKKREDINAVFHFHSPYLTAFASTEKTELNTSSSPEIIYCFGEIPKADYALPGSKELVKKTARYFNNHDVVLLANHGVITGAKDIQGAFLNIELCESYAKMLVSSKILGKTSVLSDGEICKIYSLRNN